jgi:hypothetical protein
MSVMTEGDQSSVVRPRKVTSAESAEYILRNSKALSGKDLDTLNHRTFFGVELKPLTYLLSTMNTALRVNTSASLRTAPRPRQGSARPRSELSENFGGGRWHDQALLAAVLVPGTDREGARSPWVGLSPSGDCRQATLIGEVRRGAAGFPP